MATPPVKTEGSTVDDLEHELATLNPDDLANLFQRFADKIPGGIGTRPKTVSGGPETVQRPRPDPPSAPHFDVGHLKMRIPVFSGDNQKGDLTFPQWKYEVQCILEDCRTDVDTKNLTHAIRRSLRGTAAELLRYMGSHLSVADILDAFERRFGSALTITQLCHTFFGASQGPQESLAAWSGRLEDLISQIQSCDDSHISRNAAQDMLRHQFWTGLHDAELRQATRHKYDNQASYEDLFKAVRLVQQEGVTRDPSVIGTTTKKGKAVSAPQSTSPGIDAKLDEILKKVSSTDTSVKDLQERVTKLELQQQPTQRPSSPQQKKVPKCHRCGRRGHLKSRCVAKFHVNGQPLQGTSTTSTPTPPLNFNASTPGGRR